MSQKLILPINNTKLTASIKTAAYQKNFGFVHYGADLVSTLGSRILYASGCGKVVAAGVDSVLGNVLAVRYDDAFHRGSGKARDVIFRYFHLDSMAVRAGDPVTKDTKLGVYGNTGQFSTGAHLHLEADTDTAYPLYSPTVSASNFIQGRQAGANDSTMSNPVEWLYRKPSPPDSQTWATANDIYIRAEDKTLPAIPEEDLSPSVSIQGIDVSAHNGVVDWRAVKSAGKEFAFIRAGWAGWDGGIASNNALDRRFRENMEGALEAGLHVGVYVYSYCKTPQAAAAAAHETLALIQPYPVSYPIAFDIEDVSDQGVRYDRMTKSENAAIAKAFLGAVRDAGRTGILYTYKSFAENYLDMAALSDWDVWIAQYAASCTYGGSYTIWQYQGDTDGFVGSCPGVTGACDLNLSRKDYAGTV